MRREYARIVGTLEDGRPFSSVAMPYDKARDVLGHMNWTQVWEGQRVRSAKLQPVTFPLEVGDVLAV